MNTYMVQYAGAVNRGAAPARSEWHADRIHAERRAATATRGRVWARIRAAGRRSIDGLRPLQPGQIVIAH